MMVVITRVVHKSAHEQDFNPACIFYFVHEKTEGTTVVVLVGVATTCTVSVACMHRPGLRILHICVLCVSHIVIPTFDPGGSTKKLENGEECE